MLDQADTDWAVRLAKVHKRYGDHVVLDGIDLNVARGEKLALIGPSGSGKSTVLRILMGLEPVQAGCVEVAGMPLWKIDPTATAGSASPHNLRQVRDHLGMVFQHFNLFPHRTVLRNLTEAPIRVRKTPKATAEAQAREWLSWVGLADKADAFPSQLSGGQKQRVAIARALAMEPRIMLFDEVTSALDPELVGEVLNVLRRLGEDQAMTMLLVTHEMGFAREFADRVVLMEAGRIVEQGPPEQLFDAPQQPRTAEFLRAVLSH
ncbi:MAG: ectoine/hydroxyectoine ABC transporter ATP-binding protein EhuA [Pseudomonadota bacterium]|nr:ectoine/hydroxyectoine ABC transporter ATP-binding protein EhuA [Pseudomonadota bacterium]